MTETEKTMVEMEAYRLSELLKFRKDQISEIENNAIDFYKLVFNSDPLQSGSSSVYQRAFFYK